MAHTPKLERLNSTRGIMHRCPACWIDATDGFDNGFVFTLPYPHAFHCPVRENERRKSERVNVLALACYIDTCETEENEQLARLY